MELGSIANALIELRCSDGADPRAAHVRAVQLFDDVRFLCGDSPTNIVASGWWTTESTGCVLPLGLVVARSVDHG